MGGYTRQDMIALRLDDLAGIAKVEGVSMSALFGVAGKLLDRRAAAATLGAAPLITDPVENRASRGFPAMPLGDMRGQGGGSPLHAAR